MEILQDRGCTQISENVNTVWSLNTYHGGIIVNNKLFVFAALFINENNMWYEMSVKYLPKTVCDTYAYTLRNPARDQYSELMESINIMRGV